MILGVDYARVDGNAPPDVAVAHSAGVAFVYVKRYQDPYGIDACAARDVDRWRQAGVTVGEYLFPNCKTNAAFPKVQVSAFRAAGASFQRFLDLPPALDVEFPGGIALTGRPRAAVVETIRQFVLEIEDQCGVKPVIYTSWNQWYDLGLPMAPWLADCPLWVKTAYRLGARNPVDQVVPPMPHVGSDGAHDPRDYYRVPAPWANSGAFLQQFQGDAIGMPGFTATVDVNRFLVLRAGDSSPAVKWIQRRLKTPETGIMDDVTCDAIKIIQATHGLGVDAVVGPKTFAALAWM